MSPPMFPAADRRRPPPRTVRRRRTRLLVAAAVLVAGASATVAAPMAPSGPDTTPEAVARRTLLDALAPALASRGATGTVTVAPADARRPLAPCNRRAGFMPPGARLAGKTLVGVRCVDGATWQTFLSAEIRVEASTWQATRPLRAGDVIGSSDLAVASSVLAAQDVDAAAAVARTPSGGTARATAARGPASLDGRMPAPLGRTVLRAVAAGRALTSADVRDEGRINAGDAVRVVYRGNGFAVTSEGRSTGAADPGSTVSIRLASGATVSGTLRADRLVELPR